MKIDRVEIYPITIPYQQSGKKEGVRFPHPWPLPLSQRAFISEDFKNHMACLSHPFFLTGLLVGNRNRIDFNSINFHCSPHFRAISVEPLTIAFGISPYSSPTAWRLLAAGMSFPPLAGQFLTSNTANKL